MTNTTASRNLGEELITNGGFENYAATRKLNKKGWDQFEEIEGWTSSVDKIELQTRDFKTGNTKGNTVVELDGVGNATIDTNVNVAEAGTYQFSVDYAMRGSDAGTNGFEVLVDGVVVATINPTEAGWNTLELSLELDAGAHEIQLRGIGDSDCIGTVVDNVSLRQDLDAQPPFVACDHPDAVLIDFEGLAAGTTVSDQYAGVTIKGVREENTSATNNSAMIFDGANPTGGDTDLTASGDNVLIISEDGDASDPDDNAGGGRLWIMFDEPASVHDLKVLDAEEGGRIGLVTTDQGTVWVNIPGGTDGGIQQILINVDNVVKLDVILNGSGAIDDICYIPGQPAPLGSIAGTYFMDNNDNDIQDAADMGLADQTVWLIEVGVGIVGQTKTDANGDYIFTGLDAGDYYVRFDGNNVGDKVLVESNVGNDDTVDSDIEFTGSSGNHNTGTISLAQGENVTDVDAGVETPAPVLGSISGKVFMDNNDNSLDDAGDMGLGGIEVQLRDENLNLIAKVDTNPDGTYTFQDLDAGKYIVDIEQRDSDLGSKILVTQDVDGNASDDIDSDVNSKGWSHVIDLGAGEDVIDVDAGFEDPAPIPGSLSGRYFMDTDGNDRDNGNGNEPAVAGVLVMLLDASGTPTGDQVFTDANGEYSFADLAPGTYGVKFTDPNGVLDGKELVDANWNNNALDDRDSDAIGNTTESIIANITVTEGNDTPDNDAGVRDIPVVPGSLSGRYFMDNNDNNQDDNEMGIAGVVVTLVETGATTTTAADGSYSFSDLAPGDYTVEFSDPAGVLAGKQLVDANVGPDATDSDAIGNTTLSTISNITVTEGNDTPDNDAGAEDPGTASLEGRVFCDDNDNDVDDNEQGVGGVAVTLLTAAGAVVATTTSAADGSYSFTGLDAGDYKVMFDESTAGGKTLVAQDAGSDDTVDSDADETGMTGVYTLNIGDNVTDVDAGVVAPNEAPEPEADTAKFCADKTVDIDVLANDVDADGDILSVLSIADADELAFVGESLTLDSGAVVTLNADGTVSYDASGAHDGLLVGQMAAEETITYTVSDGAGGTGSATLDITVCGTESTLQMICDSLPAQVNLSIGFDGVDYQITVVDDASTTADDGLASSVWSGACIDIYGQLLLDMDLTVNVYGTCGEIPDGLIENPENLDLINWILNEEFIGQDNMDASAQYSIFDVQEAVWALSDGTETNNANANEIVAKAQASGEGFVSGEGDLVAVIFDPISPSADVPDTQTFIMGVAWDALALDCIC